MYKRILATLMIAALFVVMGPVEMFAGTTEMTEEVTDEVTKEVVEEEAVQETAEEKVVETTPVVEEEAAQEEESVVEEEAIVEEETLVENEPAVESKGAELMSLKAAASRLSATGSAADSSTVNLTWTYTEALAEGETLYVYNGGNVVFQTTDANVTSCQVGGLTQATDYTFTFKIDDTEVGSASVQTGAGAINFRTVSSYTTVVLKWESPDQRVARYEIDCNGAGLDYGIGAGQTEYTHQLGAGAVKDIINLYNYSASERYSGNIDGQDRYSYTIRAYDANGKLLAQTANVTGDVVKTLYYKLTFKKAATLTSHSGGKVNAKFKKGQIVYARGFSNGKYIFDYQCADGKVRTYYTMKIRVKAKLSKHISALKNSRGTSTLVYTDEEAVQYINDRGITSQKNYMIWANLYSQKEYVFYSKSKGKKRDWTLVKSQLPVSTGKATAPTATGSTKINRKLKSQHGTPLWNVTKYFSVHGVQKKWKSPGWPESGACVRNLNVNAKWIYKTVPKYSRVFVH